MKFLVFTDIHQHEKQLNVLLARAKEKDIDFVVCCGDFSTFGRGAAKMLTLFNALGKKLYIIPGNHEEHGTFFFDVIEGFENVVGVHGCEVRVGNYLFMGYGGGGFAQEDAVFRKIARRWYSDFRDERLVLLLHGPPYGTTADFLNGQHVGNKDYRAFIERAKPKLVLCGHLHETFGATDMIGLTKVVNPGQEGMVIELK